MQNCFAALSNTMNFAVIQTGGKQYIVKPGQQLRVEKIEKPKRGKTITFDKVLLRAGEKKVEIGTPFVKGAKVTAEWVEEGRAKKVTILRYHSKTRYRKKKGHRQPYTKVLIKTI